MASIVNDRDITLQAADPRVTSILGAALSISASATGFVVNNEVATPTYIILTAIREGNLANAGDVTFTVVSGYVGTLVQDGDTCTVQYQGLVDASSDSCTIRATVIYLGKTYTVDSIISGKVTKPADIQNISSTTFGSYVHLTWNKNAEIDLDGYEVRLANSGWGDESILYHGNANGVLLAPSELGASITWYVRAYNTSNLYSTNTVSYTFTPTVIPAIVNTNITAAISYVSVTNNIATISWPKVTTQFLLDKYLVKIVKPGPITLDLEVTTNTVDIQADWIGDANISIATRDILKQVSTYSGVKVLTASIPNIPALPTINILGGRLHIVWSPVENTSLPVIGYEIRTANVNWGSKTVLPVWVGNSTDITIDVSAAGTEITYYITAFDTAGNYSNVRPFAYTVTLPGAIPAVTYDYSSTSVGQASCTIKWARPAVETFQLKLFRLTLVRPDLPDLTIDTLSTEWTVPADWVGTAILYAKTLDILGGESVQNQFEIIKVAPGQVSVGSKVVNYIDTNVKVTWPVATAGSLPIAGYEIRASNNITVLYRNVYNNYTFPKTQFTTPGINSYYVYAYDNAYKYGPAAVALSVPLTAPPVVTSGNTAVYSVNTLGQPIVTVFWNTPAGATFNIAYYKITFSKPGFSDIIVVNSISNSAEFAADWEGNATLTVTTYDVLGVPSATNYSTTVTKVAPSIVTSAVSSTINVTIDDNTILLNWSAPTNAGSLPIIGYLLYNSDGSVLLGETSTTSLIIQRSSYTVGTNNYRLKSKDLAGKLSSSHKAFSIVLANPGTPVSGTGVFTSSTARFTWSPPTASSFKVIEYIVSLAGAFSTVAARRNTTDWEITVPSNWSNSTGTLSVQAVDAAGFTSTALTIALANQLPATPAAPNSFIVDGQSIDIDWVDNTKTDSTLAISEYRIYNDTKTSLLWKGAVSLAKVSLPHSYTGVINYKLYAYDYNGNECTVPRSFSYTVVAPIAPNLPVITYKFGTDTSNAALSLFWDHANPTYGISGYEVSYDTTILFTNSNTIIINPIPSGWVDTAKIFNIKTVDQLLNKSVTTPIEITKYSPNPINDSDFRIEVVDNNVLLFWKLPAITTLPVAGTRIRKQLQGQSAESVGDKTGTFTSVFERRGGTYTYWLSSVDSDGQASTEIQKDTLVSEPPDFIFNGAQTSLFDSVNTLNAYTDATGLTMPVNITTTWANHFINADDGAGGNTWVSPQAQVTAGYPIYVQPSTSSGYYSEDFDFGTTFSSSKVSVNITGSNINGNPSVVTTIATSNDGSNWSVPIVGTSVFATLFRYIRVTITVSVSGVDTGKGLYKLTNLEVVLDAKLISDSGSITTTTSNGGLNQANGDVVNFGKEFIDVTAINLTPANIAGGGAALYDFVDTVIAGTYSITTNICTINTGATEHGLKPGQAIRLNFVTGGAPNGVYSVLQEVSLTSYTVSITTANTSGSVSTYPESMRIFLYDLNGTRISGGVSWSVTGY